MNAGRTAIRDYKALVEKTLRLSVPELPGFQFAQAQLDQYTESLAELIELGLRERERLRAIDERDREAREMAPLELEKVVA